MLWNHHNQKVLYSLKGNTIDNGNGPATLTVGQYATSKAFDLAIDSLKDIGTKDDRAITGVAFDDNYIVAGGMDGVIRVWEASVK